MRETNVYKPPMEVAEKGRRRASNWHLAFMLFAAVVISGVFLVGSWQPPHWFVMAVAGVVAALGTMTVASLVHTLDDIRCHYRELWTDYADLFSEHAKRAKFMINFTPPAGAVDDVLRAAAYRVLRVHQEIAALHEKGLPAFLGEPEADDPESRLQEMQRDFRTQNDGLESALKIELSRFRQLRDLAAWAGEEHFRVRKSWWDYIDAKDLPKKRRRKRTGEGELDLHPDDTQPRECGCPPDDCPHSGSKLTPAPPVGTADQPVSRGPVDDPQGF